MVLSCINLLIPCFCFFCYITHQKYEQYRNYKLHFCVYLFLSYIYFWHFTRLVGTFFSFKFSTFDFYSHLLRIKKNQIHTDFYYVDLYYTNFCKTSITCCIIFFNTVLSINMWLYICLFFLNANFFFCVLLSVHFLDIPFNILVYIITKNRNIAVKFPHYFVFLSLVY